MWLNVVKILNGKSVMAEKYCCYETIHFLLRNLVDQYEIFVEISAMDDSNGGEFVKSLNC